MDQTESATLDGSGAAPLASAATIVAAKIGRYPILRKLGEGGMGVVYAAYDDVLDRKLAIKLLRSHAGESHRRVRLLREAQGLARLSHANVVQIYEIGEHGDAVFMAMEFVAGSTLGKWLEQPRSRAAILDVFMAAGRGLAAAHAAHLIHRDFKPDNVMVAEDGQVKVMDFGLVRADSENDEVLDEDERSLTASSSHDSLGVDLTKTGAVMGTPAYMAPEQHFGRPTDARTDQFSFCVSLWEALYGTRPFAGESIAAIAFNVTQGKFAEPRRDADVPAWLRKALERGLALEPARRWPSMDALLAALADDPTQRRRTVLGVVGVGVALVLAWSLQQAELGGAAQEKREARAAAIASCEEIGRSIDAVWSDGARAKIEASFARSELAFASEAWKRTRPLLDEYAAAWTEARTRVCVEAEVDQTREPSFAELAIACLDQREAALASLASLLSEVDDARVLRAVSSAASLPTVADCTDPDELAQLPVLPDEPELRARVEALRERLARIHALDTMGEFELAATEAAAARAEAAEIEWPPAIAAATLAVGRVAAARGGFADARAAYEDAMLIAARAGDDALVLDAAVAMVYAVGVGLDDHEDGLRVAALAGALRDRLGLENSLADATLRTNTGAIHERRGELELALAEFERALTIYEATLSPAHPTVSIALNNIGTVHARQGRFGEALSYFQRTLAIREASLPPGHPRFAAAYENIGATYNAQDKYDLAGAALERALAINEANLPPDHLDIAGNAINLGHTYFEREDYAAALPLFQRALAIREAALPPDSRLLAGAHHNVGLALQALEKHEQAREHFARALEIHAAAETPEDLRLASVLHGHARALASVGEGAAAIVQLERALRIRDAEGADADDRAEVRRVLALVLWEFAPKRREEARTRMREAAALYREAGDVESARDADEWPRVTAPAASPPSSRSPPAESR